MDVEEHKRNTLRLIISTEALDLSSLEGLIEDDSIMFISDLLEKNIENRLKDVKKIKEREFFKQHEHFSRA